MGTLGITWSTRWAAVSTMRRVLQDGQSPRVLHENDSLSYKLLMKVLKHMVYAKTTTFGLKPLF
jgi:hypothetical protein